MPNDPDSSDEPLKEECGACLFIGDDHGDNTATMRCQLSPHHTALHQEQFERDGGVVTITWAADERRRCDHGCGQWEHDHDHESASCPKNADCHELYECAFCNPGEEAKTCAACGKTVYGEHGYTCPAKRPPVIAEATPMAARVGLDRALCKSLLTSACADDVAALAAQLQAALIEVDRLLGDDL